MANHEPPASKPIYLDPSPLGTKEYWSALYTTDLATREGTLPTHTGTTWFDDADAEGKTVRYLSSLRKSSPRSSTGLDLDSTTFLDLGTGNGSLLFALRKAGWRGEMCGVDYAEESVCLAKGIWEGIREAGWESEGSDDDDDEVEDMVRSCLNEVDFRTLDVISLADPEIKLPDWIPAGGYDVLLDKGTFDAVSLSSDIDLRTRKRSVELYALAAKRFLKQPSGRMIVTSCNWTESELEHWFCSTDESYPKLKVLDKVPYRTFRFGGKEGSVVVGLVFGWEDNSSS